VRAEGREILRRQQALEGVGQLLADRGQLLALDAQRRPLPQVDDPGDRRARWGRGGGGGEPARQLPLQTRRQLAEQGEMGRDPVALGRVICAPQLLKPAIVAVAEQRGDDDRAGQG
jgi:hypothetical protein